MNKEHREQIEQAITLLVQEQEKIDRELERRDTSRVVFLQTVKVRTDQGETLRLMTRDISFTGIRLIGAHRLLGQKIEIHIPKPTPPGEIPSEDSDTILQVRVLWTCEVGDQLYENGGTILDAS